MTIAPLLVQPENYSLLTDLYQLTMSACYVGEGLDQRRASFELFARRLPQHFGYLVAMGLTQVIEYLQALTVSDHQIEQLQNTGIFEHAPTAFWEVLRQAHFDGDVWAVPGGTAVFANEPLLRIEAPLWQAQLVETYLLNVVNYQTLVATRAARIRDVVGPDATLLEFGSRRAFSPQGAIWAARSAIAAGMDGTSNVLAALQLGVQPCGTMAHSLVMSITALEGGEDEAFAAFHRYFPGAPLLIDTYDTLAAARRLAAHSTSGQGALAGVRLDSGEFVSLSQQVRDLLPDVAIFASGDLDEFEIDRLNRAGACINGYGIGTQLVTGTPVNGVYKLVDIEGIPVMKESPSKTTYPGCKQIFRHYAGDRAIKDSLALATESQDQAAQPLLQLWMQNGHLMTDMPSLTAIARQTQQSVAALPEAVRQITDPDPYHVDITPALSDLTRTTRQQHHASLT